MTLQGNIGAAIMGFGAMVMIADVFALIATPLLTYYCWADFTPMRFMLSSIGWLYLIFFGFKTLVMSLDFIIMCIKDCCSTDKN
jgi:hypothetical protein